jgi:hypothetical protein
MSDFIYWATSIVATILVGLWGYRRMNKIKNVRINQQAEEMEDVTGADVELGDGENLHIQDVDVRQGAESMKNVTGMSFKAKDKQSARLQGVRIVQENAGGRSEVVISDDPNVRVEINKQE